MNDKFYEPYELSEYRYGTVNIIQPIVAQNSLWDISSHKKLKIYWSLKTREMNLKMIFLNMKRELIKNA